MWGVSASGLAVLCITGMIWACASSEISPMSSAYACLSDRMELARALQHAEELEKQLPNTLQEVEKSRGWVREKQSALASCERSPWTAHNNLPLFGRRSLLQAGMRSCRG